MEEDFKFRWEGADCSTFRLNTWTLFTFVLLLLLFLSLVLLLLLIYIHFIMFWNLNCCCKLNAKHAYSLNIALRYDTNFLPERSKRYGEQ